MFDVPLRLLRSDEWRDGGFTRFRKALGFYQEQLTFSKPQERLVALWVGAMTKHGNNCFLFVAKLEQYANSKHVHIVCQP